MCFVSVRATYLPVACCGSVEKPSPPVAFPSSSSVYTLMLDSGTNFTCVRP